MIYAAELSLWNYEYYPIHFQTEENILMEKINFKRVKEDALRMEKRRCRVSIDVGRRNPRDRDQNKYQLMKKSPE